MHNEQITLLFRQLAEADDILRESSIFTIHPDRVISPIISVDLGRQNDPLQQQDPYRISFMPVRMERVELGIAPEAVARLGERSDLRSKIVDAILQRGAVELQLVLFHGITCHGAIPHARQFRQGVEPSLPDGS